MRAWWHRVDGVAGAWVPAAIAARPSATQATSVVELPLRARAMPAPATAGAQDAAAARLGQAVHRVLEWAAATETPELDRLAAAAAAEFGAGDAAAVRAIAARILGSPDCAAFFDPRRLAWAGNEVPIVGVDGGAGQVLRIDRLVQTAGDSPIWWVLEYKLVGTPQDHQGYRDQLAAYRRAVQALQPGEVVRVAFITGRGELIEAT